MFSSSRIGGRRASVRASVAFNGTLPVTRSRCLHDIADDRLPAIVHRHMLDRDLLLAARPVPLECFHLCDIRLR